VSAVTILHTNDLHNRLDEAAAERLASVRRSQQNPLLLDAGDAVWAGNTYFRPGGEPVLERMSLAGYDAMVVGNREFHFTETGFVSKLSRASYTILCANVRPVREATLPCQPSVSLERGGVRIAIIGVTVPMVTPRSRAASFSAYVFDDPVEVCSSLAGRMRESCNLLIALTHIGLRQDIRLAQECPALDIIVGGHSHDTLERPVEVNGVAVVQAGHHGRFFGVSRLEKQGERWRLDYRLEPLREDRS
jgi:2',3'-cyclic-nucleotide 2'-phosphodiesterase (5'-nucleotidase family)